MSLKTIKLFILCFIVSTSLFAKKITTLQNQRLDAINQYVTLLGIGEYKPIINLFTSDAIAVSSSGIADTPSHFYKTLFTKTIKKPQANLINIFPGMLDHNMMTVFFDYSWENIKGQQVSAKFLDLFIFQKNTPKIKAIYVFSNTFQQDIMKQLEKA